MAAYGHFEEEFSQQLVVEYESGGSEVRSCRGVAESKKTQL